MKKKMFKKSKIHFHIVTLFPDSIAGYFEHSILARAKSKNLIDITLYNPRDFTKDAHKKVDARPYGGGPGMVLSAEPILCASSHAIGRKKKVKCILLSPSGKQFDQLYARKIVKNYKHVLLIAGHYEGIDARAEKALGAEPISIGPYTLSGGELPAGVLVDAISRQVPGVLGNESSLEESRITSSQMYTRPEVLFYKKKKYQVPRVLLSGNHKNIEKWKTQH